MCACASITEVIKNNKKTTATTTENEMKMKRHKVTDSIRLMISTELCYLLDCAHVYTFTLLLVPRVATKKIYEIAFTRESGRARTFIVISSR